MKNVDIDRQQMTKIEFESKLPSLIAEGKPLIITGLNIANVEQSWTPEYLSDKLRDRTFSIHRGENHALDFRSKNFVYENQCPAETFISDCAAGHVRYLRSVGINFRKDRPNFWSDYSEISPDLVELRIDRVHSSILRISPKDLEIWLHYDTLENLLLQCTGTKEILLFDPKDADNLYLCGDKSYCTGLISNLER